jgi:pimeloyl-ACP methyl ester carboxylesterase
MARAPIAKRRCVCCPRSPSAASSLITYRNDDQTPHEPDNRYHYGETEWQDLQAAVEYALQEGAHQVVLVGYSMGGAIVVNFLYQSALADRVAAVILDSPVLDFEATIDWGARDHFLPWPLASVGKAIAGKRFDIDWVGLNYLKQTDKLAVPILLFHGDVDKKVPVSTSDELAAARPDLVTYARMAGAGHVRA